MARDMYALTKWLTKLSHREFYSMYEMTEAREWKHPEWQLVSYRSKDWTQNLWLELSGLSAF